MKEKIPNRVDRDRALGNAVVPQQAAFAFEALMSSAGIGKHPTTLPESMRSDDRPGVSADSETAGAGRSEVGE